MSPLALQQSLLAVGEPAVQTGLAAERVELGGGAWVELVPCFVAGADELLFELIESTDWRRGRRRMYDRVVDEPRLSRWYRRADALPHRVLGAIGAELDHRYGRHLRGPGLNYYRTGADSVAFHRDNELRYLDDTLVAIVTFGARRPFLLRPLGGGPSVDLAPGSGDLLVMGGRCQADREHAVPKVRAAGPRVSASWRWSARTGRAVPPPAWSPP